MAEGSLCFSLNKASDEDQNADEDQDRTAEDACFARKLRSDLFADDDTAKAGILGGAILIFIGVLIFVRSFI